MSQRHPQDPGETELRRLKMSSVPSSGTGARAKPEQTHSPGTRILERNREGENPYQKKEASSREMVRSEKYLTHVRERTHQSSVLEGMPKR